MRLEVAVMEKGWMGLKLQTRVFEVGKEKRVSLAELAMAMGISLSQFYRVRQGKRSINGKFIIGAIKAFPGYKLNELFYVSQDGNGINHE